INTSIAVPVFISILQDRSAKDDLRADAAWALGEMGDVSAREPLITAMASDPDSQVRINAAKALKSIGRTNVPVYSI
ncbi:MAG TPA: HEAT repeat domain-containing protein, partial [Methanothrix sp.]|nr:HEAT repeat domain-containing protein [Methanothrix sp.]